MYIFNVSGTPQESLQFSNNHGANIRLDAGSKVSSTISVNPCSVCVIHLKVGETIKLKCGPVTDSSRDPSLYHVTLQVTDNSPDELKRNCPWMFYANARPGQASITTLEILKRGDCKGMITVSLRKSNIVEYTTASNKSNTQVLQFVTSYGVFLVMELFRVSMTIIEKTERNCGEKQGRLGQNVVDSHIREPMNADAMNTMWFGSLPGHEIAQDYVSVTEAKQVITTNNNSRSRKNNESSDNPNNNTDITQVKGPQANGANTNDTINNLKKRLDEVEATQAETQTTQKEIMRMLRNNNNSLPVPVSVSPIRSHSPSVPGELDMESLKPKWPELVRTMRADRLCDYLFQKGVISEHDMLDLFELSKVSAVSANRSLLQILSTKRVRRSLMVEILESAEEGHLIPMMFPL